MKTPIDMALEAQYIQRWSMLSKNASSTVASHSFNVALISMALHKAMFNTNHIDMHRLCFHAMMHDIEEVYTGDIPTPTKTRMRNMGFDPNEMSDTLTREDPVPEEMEVIIRMADLIDNATWIAGHGVGGRAAAVAGEVADRLAAALAEARIDLRRAAEKVINQIKHRTSNEEKERKQAKEDSKRLASTKYHERNPLVMDRKPCDSCGGLGLTVLHRGEGGLDRTEVRDKGGFSGNTPFPSNMA